MLDETLFEEHFTDMLSHSPLYNERAPQDFDIDNLVDRGMLERFLQAQPKVWKRLQDAYGNEATDAVIKEYNNHLYRKEAMQTILRKGLTLKGIKVKLMQLKPVLGGESTENYKLYLENRFSIVRQMKYSTAAKDKDNRLDLCILVNGLPIITCELKNEGTGQNYLNAIHQYRNDRDADNRMLKTCMVHFAIDNNYVFMTTKLNGLNTRFLPFNRETQNMPIEGEYPTAYMYRDFMEGDYEMTGILMADSLLDLIENFIKTYEEDGKKVTIFPRFQQLRAVRKLRKAVREEGPGHNYLIQHSAGSGKTKTMAWLAHQLANMSNEDNTPVFHSIIMVTDRIVLNRNMADDVVNFEVKAGTVKDVRTGSKNLATAINDGYRIIITTVQKFAFALPTIKHTKDRKYAIIIDEAHTAIGNESAKDIIQALSSDEDLKEATDFNREDYDSDMDAIMAYMQSSRQKMHHLSYFAFTATPKDKTYAIFGRNGKAFDLYSMKQAIDEGFILDVLLYYKSYKTMIELVEKDEEKDKDKLFAEKKALKLIYKDLSKNSYIMLRKATIILDHFMHHTINKINGQAKAMVVCDSRRAAADYKRIIDRLIQQQYGGEIKTLVAFSGEVEDSHGRKCTEANMNDEQAADNDIRELFKKPDYKILIVAEKFQTGFDQPLLHTMYVDKMLGGIQCIQTLSRLNRCCAGKEDTMIIDFRNDKDDVQKAFQKYYTETELVGEPDTQRVYSMMNEVKMLDGKEMVSGEEVNEVVSKLLKKETAVAVPSIFKRIVEDRVKPLSESNRDKYRKLVGRYVRQYGFIAQLMDFIDPELEKFYVFCKFFYKYLPYTKETLPVEILELIDLDKLRIQAGYEGQLKLEDEKAFLPGTRIGDVNTKRPDDEKTVKEIIGEVNEPYKGFLDENDKILKQIWDELLADPEIDQAFNAENSFDMLMKLVKDKFDEKVANEIEKYYNFAEVLEKEKGFSIALISRFVDALTRRAAQNHRLTYDEEALKEKMADMMNDEFLDLFDFPKIEKVVDGLFFVLNTQSLDKLDGIDDILKDTFNKVFMGKDMHSVEKRLNFNTLVSSFEQFLKKLYYLIYGEEVEPHRPDRPNGTDAYATLSNAIYALRFLRNLRYENSVALIKFAHYLEQVKQWRNVQAHDSPVVADDNIATNTRIVVAMYLYSAGKSLKSLQSSGD